MPLDDTPHRVSTDVATPDGSPSASPAGDPVEQLRALLVEARAAVEHDPFANPIQLLSLRVAERLRAGELDDATVESLIRRLTLEAFLGRAGRLGAYLGEVDPERNAAILAELFRRQAHDADGALLPFPVFQERTARVLYGFVVTAHPTFSLAAPLQRDLVALALGRTADGRPLDEPARADLLARVEAAHHRPEASLDLVTEHVQSLAAVQNLQAALRRVYGTALDVAAELYPDDWWKLTPRLATVASWVGYDTDGRADISWRTSFEKRLLVQIAQLRHYAGTIKALRVGLASDDPLASLLELAEARLALALKSAQDERDAFAEGPGDDASRLARTARAMAEGRSLRLHDSRELSALVERCLPAAREPATRRALATLRAEIATHGFASAGTHVRINAVQLHNAIRKQIGMEHAPDDPTHRLTYVEAVARLIDEAKPVRINFGSLGHEKATARRAFMLVAQMLKYLDAAEPIRFLIAECETPLTVLTALYFAKLFGVDDRIDISPLFETRKALERGIAILDGALAVPAYRDYVRRRGRLCFQTGFSDAGRYLGQTAASVAIERIRLDLAAMLRRHDLLDVEVVVFDTHGESIGRGAHPAGFADRLRYYDTPESRRRFAEAGLRVVQESSYQGGDGYLHFSSEDSALAVVTRVLEHVMGDPAETPDPFYDERVYVDEFFAAVRQFNDRIIENPAYATLLGLYGTNLLYPTGSRSVRRQHDTGSPRPSVEHPSQIRAIPHNSILQQLGILANTIGGVGQAAGKDPQRFLELYRASPRFRRLMAMVEHAFMYTDLEVVRAYLERFDAETWLLRADDARTDEAHEELRLVADHVERLGLSERLMRVFRTLQRDWMDLARALRTHRRQTRDAGRTPIAVDPATRDNLHMLHALRLALIDRLMRRAVHVPDFSDRHALSHDDLVEAIMRLEVEPAVRLLGDIFPVVEETAASLDWGEPSTYEGDGAQSYAVEHATIFRPMAQDYELIRRLGSAIVHHLGAVG